jgi:hypothetical protein
MPVTKGLPRTERDSAAASFKLAELELSMSISVD